MKNCIHKESSGVTPILAAEPHWTSKTWTCPWLGQVPASTHAANGGVLLVHKELRDARRVNLGTVNSQPEGLK